MYDSIHIHFYLLTFRNVENNDVHHSKDSLLKRREIWNGLAFCLDVITNENEQGKIQQSGLDPSLEVLQAESYC